MVLVITAIMETLITFALIYALLQVDDGRGYFKRVKDALMFKL